MNKEKFFIIIKLFIPIVLIVGCFLLYNYMYSFSLDSYDIELFKNEHYYLKINNKKDDEYEIISSNLDIVNVNDNYLIGKEVGTTEVVVKSKKSFNKKVLKIKVLDMIVADKEIKVNCGKELLKVNDTFQLTTNDGSKVEWKSLNDNIAVINEDGLLTALNEGVVQVNAKAGDLFASCIFEIIKVENEDEIVEAPIEEIIEEPINETPIENNPTGNDPIINNTPIEPSLPSKPDEQIDIKVNSIKLNASSYNLNLGNQIRLKSTISPSNAINKTLIWSSSNPSVATVDQNGLVVSKSAGNTIIKVSVDNVSSECLITVISHNVESNDSLTLSKTSQTIYLNSSIKSYSVDAILKSNKYNSSQIKWSSSNSSVASVSGGIISPIDIGETTITASVGDLKASMKLIVKKKIIVELGASQSHRFITDKAFDYSSKNGINYHYESLFVGDKNNPDRFGENSTLIHIARSGAGMQYQIKGGDGHKRLSDVLNYYSNKKKYVEFYIYYLLIGNTISDYTCDEIEKDYSSEVSIQNGTAYSGFINGYNDAIVSFKNSGYNVKGYVVSMHPVRPNEVTSSNSKTVSNSNSNYCSRGYRSNWKYNVYNNKVKNMLKNNSNLIYVDTFNEIMDKTGATLTNRAYSYKVNYHTDDGVHWREDTTLYYLKLMLDKSNANI